MDAEGGRGVGVTVITDVDRETTIRSLTACFPPTWFSESFSLAWMALVVFA